MTYHIIEEYLIVGICFILTFRSWNFSGIPEPFAQSDLKTRNFIFGSGFLILGISGLIHSTIHAFSLDHNVLYQTLIGYCIGLLCIIVAISSERPKTKLFFPALLYLPILFLLWPGIYEKFPLFEEFRPLVWISIAYLAGVAFILHVAMFYRTRVKRMLLASFGFFLICISSTFLFFPASIGSTMWLHGHVFRPLGFLALLMSIPASPLEKIGGGSILYRALTAFSLLSAAPLLILGTVVFYENINPISISGRRILIFLLMMVSFTSALIFGLGMIIRLIGPILHLKGSVDKFADHGLDSRIEVTSSDEIGELTLAFNEMMEKLDRAVEQREQFSRLAATGELAATLAHEIKNPLNAISGAASYIQKNYQGKLIEEFLKVISDEASRINNLTRALLDFSKPLKPKIEPQNVYRLIDDIMRLFELEFKEQKIALEINMAPDIPPIAFDYNQIKQLLINLLINAIQASGPNGTVSLSTSYSDNTFYLTVADNGSGISSENLKKIFNPFYTTKTRGTGLGLAVSKRIAREHGGDLTVESTVEIGTRFTLTLKGNEGHAV